MATTKAKLSEYGLNYGAVVDVAALSDDAAAFTLNFTVVIGTAGGQTNTAHYVINATTTHNLGLPGRAGIITAAYITYGTVPVGGTLTHAIAFLDKSNANTVVVCTDTAGTDPEAATADTSQAQTLATTNVAMAADDLIVLQLISSNATVTTDAAEVRVTLVMRPTAPATAVSSYRL